MINGSSSMITSTNNGIDLPKEHKSLHYWILNQLRRCVLTGERKFSNLWCKSKNWLHQRAIRNEPSTHLISIPQLRYFLSISPFPKTLRPQNCEYANPQMPHIDYQHHHFHFVVSHSSKRTINSSTLACTFGSLRLQNSTLVNMIPSRRAQHMCPYCGVHQDIREFIVHSSVAYVVGSSVNRTVMIMLNCEKLPPNNQICRCYTVGREIIIHGLSPNPPIGHPHNT
jgi:hypothetical protein